MRRKLKFIFLYFGIFLFTLWGAFQLCFWIDTQEEKKQVIKDTYLERLSPSQEKLLQEGDIILRRGYGFFSDIIAQRLNDDTFDVTHSGILYRKNNQWWVIHSLSSDVSPIDGMQEQPLGTFLKYSTPKKILIVRPKHITPTEGKEVVKKALYYLHQKIPFDHIGTIDDPSALYCSELIYQILDNDLHLISFPTEKKERKDTFYTMKTLYDPSFFEIIVNTYPEK